MSSRIRNDIIAMNIMTTLTVLSIIGVLFLVYDRFVYKKSIEEDVVQLAEMTAGSSMAEMVLFFSQTEEQFQTLIENADPSIRAYISHKSLQSLATAKSNPHVLFAGVYAGENSPLATYTKKGYVLDAAEVNWSEGIQYGMEHLSLLHPVKMPDGSTGFVFIVFDHDAYYYAHINNYLIFPVLAFVLGMVLVFFISLRLQRSLSQPINDLLTTIRFALKDKQYIIRAKSFSDNETGQLVDIFNDLLDRLQVMNRELSRRTMELGEKNKETTKLNYVIDSLHGQLLQSEKLAVVGKLATGVSHEVKNPLSIILQGVEYLTNTVPTEDKVMREVIEDINTAVQKADTTIRGVLDYSRVSKLDMMLMDVNAIIEGSMNLVKHQFRLNQIEINKQFTEHLPMINADKFKMEQLFVNLFVNAIQAMDKHGTLTVHTYSKKIGMDDSHSELLKSGIYEPGDILVVTEIRDTGKGIPSDVLKHIFDPFFTTKKATGGTGLGMSIIKNIVELHKGDYTIENHPDGGVLSTVMLKAEG